MKRAEFIERWLDALESGKYKQARKTLRRGKKDFHYCCLGVACELANQIAPMKFDWNEKDDWNELLPKKLSKFMGIQEDGSFKHGIWHRGTYHHSLTDLNDNGVRFPTIAKIIREQLSKKNFMSPR